LRWTAAFEKLPHDASIMKSSSHFNSIFVPKRCPCATASRLDPRFGKTEAERAAGREMSKPVGVLPAARVIPAVAPMLKQSLPPLQFSSGLR
jgi:hypothetical protein